MKLFKSILAVMMMAVTLSLAACGSDSDGDDDDGPDSIDRSDIVGTWNCEDTGMDIDRLIFYNDGTGLVEYGSRNNTSKYDFNWRLSSGRLYIDGEDVSLIQRGRRLSLTYLGDTYTWASSSTSGGGTTGGTTGSIESIVRDNVKCTASYSDYCPHITINHSLKSEIPGATVSYIVGHSERGWTDAYDISTGLNSIVPQVSTSGSNTTVKIDSPIYYYFYAKKINATRPSEESIYNTKAGRCEMYYMSYKALNDKLKNGQRLDSEEQSLYNSAKKELDNYQSEARGSYSIWVYVTVNGTKYLISKINV